MNFLRVILVLLASVRLLQPSGVCGCKVVEAFHGLACQQEAGDPHHGCHCCLDTLDCEQDESQDAFLTESHHPLAPMAPPGHLPGKNCVGLISTLPTAPGLEKVDWDEFPVLVESLPMAGFGSRRTDPVPGWESGLPVCGSLPRLFLLNCSILL